jgi:uncharacterized RDD family membrane protein YckC
MASHVVNPPHPGVRRQIFAFGYELITSITIIFSSGFLVAALIGENGAVSSKIITNVVPLVTVSLYYVVCWRKTGQSLAQKSWGLKVTDKNGELLSMSKSITRVFLSGVLNLLGVSIIFLIFSKNHQPLQDKILGTLVTSSR